jgi:catechol 2,3-dioxygenase-like lactoylglutathione lyase family enzyme
MECAVHEEYAMATLHSVHPVLMASDVGASIRFYEGLGFSLTFQDNSSDPKYAAVTRDGVELNLQWHDANQWADSSGRPTYRFYVEDVDGLYAELRKNGCLKPLHSVNSPWLTPGDTPWGTREFHLYDPDRNGLQFYRML